MKNEGFTLTNKLVLAIYKTIILMIPGVIFWFYFKCFTDKSGFLMTIQGFFVVIFFLPFVHFTMHFLLDSLKRGTKEVEGNE